MTDIPPGRLLRGLARFATGEVRRRPRTLYLEVTMRCNAHCDFCGYWQAPRPPELPDYAPVVRRFRPLAVVLTGGEPLVRRDLETVVQGIRGTDDLVYIALITNGALLTVERARELRRCGLDAISISLNHAGIEQDGERGIPGLFEHLREVVPRVAGIGFKRVTLNSVLMRSTIEHAGQLVTLARRWGVTISFSTYAATKNGNRTHHIEPQDLGRLDGAVRLLRLMRREGWPIENSDWYLARVPDFFRDGAVPGCPAGRKFFHVTPDGFVKLCPDLPRVSHFSMFDPRQASPVDCARCWYACRGEEQAPLDPMRAVHFAGLWLGA